MRNRFFLRRRCLFVKFAEIPDRAFPAFRVSRGATVAAVKKEPVVRVMEIFLRADASDTSSGVFPGAMPVRFATRKMWVSTATVG